MYVHSQLIAAQLENLASDPTLNLGRGRIYFNTGSGLPKYYDGSAWQAFEGITALTSDVSASGIGSVAATVNSVGGATAANIASATTLALAATNANTASAIVKRDSSGNFTAGTITATFTGNLTGNVTGNVSGTALSITGTNAIANGGTGQTTAATAFTALSPLTTKGDILGFSTLNARVAVGGNGTVLTADSTQALGVKWAAVLTNPMTTQGDIIFENSSPAPARLAIGSSGQVLNVAAGQPAWHTLVGSDIPLADSSSNAGTVNPYAGTGVVYSGRWTPTITSISNSGSSTSASCHYSRVGSIVTCSGYISLTSGTTLNGNVIFDLSLPIATTLVAAADLAGVGTWNSGSVVAATGNGSAYINMSSGSKARVNFINTLINTAEAFSFTFSYQIG